jgi:hypothetical protein
MGRVEKGDWRINLEAGAWHECAVDDAALSIMFLTMH